MSLMFEPIRKYASFKGRARRREYWLFQLFMIAIFSLLIVWLMGTLPTGLDGASPEELSAAIAASPGAGTPVLIIGVAGLFFVLPSLAVSVRRLHDSDKSGWWLLLSLLAIGGLVLFIFYLLDGTKGPNSYGEDPKARA